MNYTFAGKLSLGVDEVTNTIIVSAKGEDLLKLVCDLIEELDRKAKKSESVQVVQVNGTSTKALEKALKNLLRPKVGLDQKGQNPQNLRLSPGLGGQIVPNFPYGNNSSDDASDNAPNSADN